MYRLRLPRSCDVFNSGTIATAQRTRAASRRLDRDNCACNRYERSIAVCCSRSEDERVAGGVMSLEEFASVHPLPERWLSLRRECEALVCNPQYWYRPDLQNAARVLAVDASDILHARLADIKQ